jgi:hypothetical protein
LKTAALSATLLFVHGRTTERTVTAAERLGRALGVTVVELVSIGPSPPATLLTTIAANGATAFLPIMALTFGLILPRTLFERVMPARCGTTVQCTAPPFKISPKPCCIRC